MSGLITLALDTAVGNGGLSLLRGNDVIGNVEKVSRTDELLVSIDCLLAEYAISIAEIRLIAVSVGPGSFTGIRVGIATALGLKASIGARCVGVNAFDALRVAYPNEDVIVLPLGRGYYALKDFSVDRPEIQITDEDELSQILNDRSSLRVADYSETGFREMKRSRICTEAHSTLIGQYALAGGGSEEVEPVYIRRHKAVKRGSL
jgi:tRNA threonylcarbamoyl adenosine modification protein YeaZ